MTIRGATTRTMTCTAVMVFGVAASLSAQDTTQTRDTTRATRDTAQATAQQRIPVQKRESFGDVNLRRDTSAARDTAAITDPFRRDTAAVPRDTMMRDTTMRDTTMRDTTMRDTSFLQRDTSAFRTDTTVRDTSLLQRDTSLIPRDTSAMMQRDTSAMRDTSVMRDTSFMRDTTVRDTSAIRDTSAVQRDTSLFQRDTSLMRDTSQMQRDTSTIFRTDTSTIQRDTSIVQRDTLAQTDTLLRTDTTLMRTDTAMTDTTMTDTAAVRTDTSLVQLDTVTAGGEVVQQGMSQPRYLLGGTGLYVGFAAGANPTVGDLEELGYDGGFAIAVPIGWHRPTSPFGVRLDLGYNRFNGGNFTFTNAGVPVTIGNPDPEVWSAVLNATLGFPLTASGTTRLYLVGGGGLYHFRGFGRGSSLSGFLGNDVLDPNDEGFESSLNKFGVNGGAGLEWTIGAWGLFLESRFVNVFADRGDDFQFDQFFGDRSDHVRWIPITLGVTIR